MLSQRVKLFLDKKKLLEELGYSEEQIFMLTYNETFFLVRDIEKKESKEKRMKLWGI